MKKLLSVVALLLAVAVSAKAEPLAFKLSENVTFIAPLQVVKAIQLYSFSDNKGYIGAETTLVQAKNFRFNFGAAPVLGTGENVPFLSIETRLSEKFFDISDNDMYFGIWAGKQSNKKSATVGIAASIQLW